MLFRDDLNKCDITFIGKTLTNGQHIARKKYDMITKSLKQTIHNYWKFQRLLVCTNHFLIV